VLLLLDLYPLRRVPLTRTEIRTVLLRLIAEKIPLFLASAAITALMLVIGTRTEIITPLSVLSVRERLAIAGYSLGFYLWKTLVPWPLSPLYELHLPIRPLSASYLLPGATVVAITAATVAMRRRWPAGLTVWLVYVILLLPVIGVAYNGTQVTADRYSYLPCLGWAVLAGAGVVWCWRAAAAGMMTPWVARLLLALSVAIICSLGALTTFQVRVWRDSETLWQHAIALDPDSAFAHYNLAGTLFTFGRVNEARVEFERALTLLPDRLSNAKAAFHASLGELLQRQGDAAQAEQHFQAALGLSAYNVAALTNLGIIYVRRGESIRALDLFRRALRAVPGYPAACLNGQRLAAVLGVAPPELQSCLPAQAP
jgi:protein O-mannosyl-transferase